MSIAEDIAKYVHSVSYSDIPKSTIHDAERLIVDTLGCAIGAFDSEPARIVSSIGVPVDSKYVATILGTRTKTIAPMAAFANGTMSRYLDFMDTYDGKEFSHPSDNILPLFAVAEASGKNGRDLLLAIVLAYEIQSRLADAAALWTHGWDQVTYLLVSVAATASKLMGLDEEKTAQAINIALSSHVTMRQVRGTGELSMWKAAAAANSARNAIFAVNLAARGMTGPAPIFEGEMGLWKLITGKFELNTRKFGNKRNKFKLGQGLIKYYPVETRAQTAVWCALQLRRRIKSLSDVKSIVIGTNEAGYKILGKDPEKWDPKTRETADHSLPYVIARAMTDEKVDMNSFSERKFRDKSTLKFMKLIKVREIPKFTRLFKQGGTVNAADLTIILNDGTRLYEEQIYSKGHAKNPMTDQEIEQKFRHLAKRFLVRSKQDALLEAIWHFDKLEDVGKLFWIIS